MRAGWCARETSTPLLAGGHVCTQEAAGRSRTHTTIYEQHTAQRSTACGQGAYLLDTGPEHNIPSSTAVAAVGGCVLACGGGSGRASHSPRAALCCNWNMH